MITISAFAAVPPFAQGLVRDLRVRWALEEAGLGYRVRLIDPSIQASDEYRRLQPFGQVPAFEEDGGVALFESGAIVLHLAARSAALFPADPAGRARATAWVFAAINSLEPSCQMLAELDLFPGDPQLRDAVRPMRVERVRTRLADLARWLDTREYLESRFTVGDLMMTTVLRILRHTELVAEQPALKAFQERCEARPPFARALAAQLADFAPR